jgi:hypothetical protein
MNIKSIVLRIAVIGTILIGAGIYTHPVKASSCFAGNACLTDAHKVGFCGTGGADPCSCIGKDGSETPNAPDCSEL